MDSDFLETYQNWKNEINHMKNSVENIISSIRSVPYFLSSESVFSGTDNLNKMSNHTPILVFDKKVFNFCRISKPMASVIPHSSSRFICGFNLPSEPSCLFFRKFKEDLILEVGGNMYFVIIRINDKDSNIGLYWIASSEASPKYVKFMDFDEDYVYLGMSDGMVLIYYIREQSIVEQIKISEESIRYLKVFRNNPDSYLGIFVYSENNTMSFCSNVKQKATFQLDHNITRIENCDYDPCNSITIHTDQNTIIWNYIANEIEIQGKEYDPETRPEECHGVPLLTEVVRAYHNNFCAIGFEQNSVHVFSK